MLSDDLDNPGGGLEGMSTDDSRSFVLSGSRTKKCQLSSVIVSCLRSFSSEGKFPSECW